MRRQYCLLIVAILSNAAAVPAPASSVTVVAAPATGTPDGDAGVLRRLRQAYFEADPSWAAGLTGWVSASQAHPCSWPGVTCDQRQHVTALKLSARLQASNAPTCNATLGAAAARECNAPLLPELAQLHKLQTLWLECHPDCWPRIPPEWLVPGAFPQLTRLWLHGRSLAAPLPAATRGALPNLMQLELEFCGMATTLPPSWGADVATLPELRHLTVQAQVQGSLPAQWARGFSRLTSLTVMSIPAGLVWPHPAPSRQATAGAATMHDALEAYHVAQQQAAKGAGRSGGSAGAAAPAGEATAWNTAWPGLPAEWASGFPRLEVLALVNLNLSGTLPSSWAQAGSFPSLVYLAVQLSNLSGPLPEQLLSIHPQLQTLWLNGNRISGELPASWAAAGVNTGLISLRNNFLSGPAFPPAWTRPGALPLLDRLDLGNNPGLSGSLPPQLWCWPKLTILRLDGTSVQGTQVPSAWCKAPFARNLHELRLANATTVAVFPPCARSAFPYIFPSPWLVSNDRAHAWQHALLIGCGIAALLLLAIVLAAAGSTAHGLGQQSRGQRKGSSCHGPQEVRFLLSDQLQQPRSGCSGSSSSSSSTDGSSCTQLASRRVGSLSSGGSGSNSPGHTCSRLGALLSRALGPGGTLEMHSLAELPGALTHELRRLCPVPEHTALLPHRGAGTGPPPASASASSVADMGSCRAPAAAWSREHGRSWGLSTASLMLRPSQLELAVTSEGELVQLGRGGSAAVYAGRMACGPVAVKVFELPPGQDSHTVWQEVSLLRRCCHDRIVPLLGVVVMDQFVGLSMRHMEGGSLRSALLSPKTREALRWHAGGRQVALDVAQGLAFLHEEALVLHGDIKPSNVLLTENLRGCIADLGLARVVCSHARPAAGFTTAYAAPEQLLGLKCTLAADVYSLGVLLAELVTQKPVNRRVAWELPRAPEQCSPGVLALINECMSQDPALRPSAAEVLQRLQAECVNADV